MNCCQEQRGKISKCHGGICRCQLSMQLITTTFFSLPNNSINIVDLFTKSFNLVSSQLQPSRISKPTADSKFQMHFRGSSVRGNLGFVFALKINHNLIKTRDKNLKHFNEQTFFSRIGKGPIIWQ